MASWDDVRAHLRATFAVVRDSPDGIAMSWKLALAGHELVQGVGIAPIAIEARPWLTMIADLCTESELPLRTALLYQDRLPIGAIVLRKDTFLMKHNLPLETPYEELDFRIRLLAHEAARLRLNLKARTPAGDPFGNYAE